MDQIKRIRLQYKINAQINIIYFCSYVHSSLFPFSPTRAKQISSESYLKSKPPRWLSLIRVSKEINESSLLFIVAGDSWGHWWAHLCPSQKPRLSNVLLKYPLTNYHSFTLKKKTSPTLTPTSDKECAYITYPQIDTQTHTCGISLSLKHLVFPLW